MKKPTLYLALLLLNMTTGCHKHIPYDPFQPAAFHNRPENIELEFFTQKGRQVAFYIPQANCPENPPSRICILFPGITSLALDWLRIINLNEDADSAYLLIDYPGRGFSEGMMQPEKNHLNSEGALKALAAHFGLSQINAEINLLGHSFGTGAALQFAAKNKVSRIVLVAPFTTLRKAVAIKSFFLSLVMPSQIDNRAIIRSLLQTEDPPCITILHGNRDKSIPVTMGRELAAIAPDRIDYHEFENDDHVSILTIRRYLIFRALHGTTRN